LSISITICCLEALLLIVHYLGMVIDVVVIVVVQCTVYAASISLGKNYTYHLVYADTDMCFAWYLAHSQTVMILSWSGWKHMPTWPIEWGSVTQMWGSCPPNPASQAFEPVVPHRLPRG
jgi:hypothetical protein